MFAPHSVFSVTAITTGASRHPNADARPVKSIPEIPDCSFPFPILSFFPSGEKVETGTISKS
jgi:hypothetical protein